MNYIVLLCWLAACAFQDAQQRRIANQLTLGGLAIAILYLLWSGNTLTGATPTAAVLAAVVACALSLPGYLTRQMGAADVKLLVALGVASDAMHVLLSVIGAALTLCCWTLLTRFQPELLLLIPKKFKYLAMPKLKNHPYAPFLFLGFAISSLWLIARQ